MWKISEMACLIVMIALSVKDIKMHKVSAYGLLAAGAASICYQWVIGKMDIKLILGGIVVGMLFIVISKVTQEGIGYGDSLGILILGIYLGIWGLLTVVSIAFFLLLCVMIPLLFIKRMSRKCALPFYPFLTIGYLGLLLMEGVNT